MNLLLDTHIALWAIADAPALSAKARSLIQNADNTVWISAATIWEISIKHALGKGDMPVSGEAALAYFRAAGYSILDITPSHAIHTSTLPWHHKDPFDRMLIAQAQSHPMHLISSDAQVAKYGACVVVA